MPDYTIHHEGKVTYIHFPRRQGQRVFRAKLEDFLKQHAAACAREGFYVRCEVCGCDEQIVRRHLDNSIEETCACCGAPFPFEGDISDDA